MQIKPFLGAAVLSYFSLVSAQGSITLSFSPQQSSAVASQLSTFNAGITTQPAFASAASVLATAIPASQLSVIPGGANGLLYSLITAGTPPLALATAIPSSVEDFILDIQIDEVEFLVSLLPTQTLTGAAPKPTNGLQQLMVGGVAAAGVVGLAML